MLPATITFVACMGFVATVCYGCLSFFQSSSRRITSRRVFELAGRKQLVASRHSIWQRLAGYLTKLTPRQHSTSEDMRSRLRKAGYYHPHSLPLYHGLRAGLMIIGGLVGAAILLLDRATISIVAGCVASGAMTGYLLAGMIVDRMILTRHKKILTELPDLSDLLSVCMNAGLSLEAAIHFIVDEFGASGSVLEPELRLIRQDLNLGLHADEAFKRCSERCSHDSINILATFMKESRKKGMSITDAVRQHGSSIRTEIEQEAEELSQKAAVKILFPTLLLIMPATFVVLVGPAIIMIHEAFAR